MSSDGAIQNENSEQIRSSDSIHPVLENAILWLVKVLIVLMFGIGCAEVLRCIRRAPALASQTGVQEIRLAEAAKYVEDTELQHLRRKNDELLALVAKLTSEVASRRFDLDLANAVTASCQQQSKATIRTLTENLAAAEKSRLPSFETLEREIESSKYRTVNLVEGDGARIWAVKTKGLPEYFQSHSVLISPLTGAVETEFVSSHCKVYVEDKRATERANELDKRCLRVQ